MSLDRLLEVAVGGGDDADVDLDRLGAAEALDHPLLEHAQELDLDLQRQVADLVEEQRRPSAASKRPICRESAPVYAPRSRPNSSLSIRAVGMAAQLTRTIGR